MKPYWIQCFLVATLWILAHNIVNSLLPRMFCLYYFFELARFFKFAKNSSKNSHASTSFFCSPCSLCSFCLRLPRFLMALRLRKSYTNGIEHHHDFDSCTPPLFFTLFIVSQAYKGLWKKNIEQYSIFSMGAVVF